MTKYAFYSRGKQQTLKCSLLAQEKKDDKETQIVGKSSCHSQGNT